MGEEEGGRMYGGRAKQPFYYGGVIVREQRAWVHLFLLGSLGRLARRLGGRLGGRGVSHLGPSSSFSPWITSSLADLVTCLGVWVSGWLAAAARCCSSWLLNGCGCLGRYPYKKKKVCALALVQAPATLGTRTRKKKRGEARRGKRGEGATGRGKGGRALPP